MLRRGGTLLEGVPVKGVLEEDLLPHEDQVLSADCIEVLGAGADAVASIPRHRAPRRRVILRRAVGQSGRFGRPWFFDNVYERADPFIRPGCSALPGQVPSRSRADGLAYLRLPA